MEYLWQVNHLNPLISKLQIDKPSIGMVMVVYRASSSISILSFQSKLCNDERYILGYALVNE